jgi:hypothetical protein
MTADRIKEIQDKTAFPDSVSVCRALLQVWNECEQNTADKKYTKEDMLKSFWAGVDCEAENGKNFEQFINSLNKQD